MGKYFRFPFASAGDTQVVPDEADPGNNVSYEEGYTANYEIDFELDPVNAKLVERTGQNTIFNQITQNLKDWQERLFPDFITAADNGGVPFEYSKGNIVIFGGVAKISLQDNNNDLPSEPTWADLFPLPVEFGGTGVDTVNDLALALNLGTAAAADTGTGSNDVPTITDADARYLQQGNDLSDLNSASTARTNLGLGSISTQNSSAFTDTLLSLASASSWLSALGGAETDEGIKTGDIVKSADLDITNRDFLPASGQLVNRVTYADLFGVIGERFGSGDGVNTFRLPNLNNSAIPGGFGSWVTVPLTGYGDEVTFSYYGVDTDRANGDIYAVNTLDTDDTVYLFAEGGTSWTAITRNGLPAGDMGRGIGISAASKDLVVTIGEDPWILESGSGIWAALPITGLPASRGVATRILYDDTNNRIYAKFANFDEIYWTDDDGLGTWSAITTTGLPGIGSIVDYAVNADGDLLTVDDDDPVVYKLDFGAGSWVALSDLDLPDTGTGRLSVGYNTGLICFIVGTDIFTLKSGDSVWLKRTVTSRINSPVEIAYNEFTNRILSSGTASGDLLEALTFNEEIGLTFEYIKY